MNSLNLALQLDNALIKMKKLILTAIFILLGGNLIAQNRDLDFYIEQAKINSPLLNKNNNENKIVELDLQQVKSILSKPEISLEASVLFAPIVSHDNNSNKFKWTSDGADEYTGFDLASTDGGQYQAFIALKQPLFNSIKYQAYSEHADILSRENENATALTSHEIEQVVGYQFILCLKSYLQAQNSLQLTSDLKKQLLVMRKLVETGVYKQTDLMLLELESQNYELEYQSFLFEYKSNLYDLNLICGVNDTLLIGIKELNLRLNNELSSPSLFLVSYKLDSLNIRSEQKISELKYKPEINLFANAGLNAVYLPSVDRIGFSTGLNVSWNIFDGNQKKIQREKSFINLQSIEFDKNYFLNQNSINKNKILDQFEALDLQILLIDEQLAKYEEIFNVYIKELSQGLVSVMDFNVLLKDLAGKRQQRLNLKMDKQMLISLYNYWNY